MIFSLFIKIFFKFFLRRKEEFVLLTDRAGYREKHLGKIHGQYHYEIGQGSLRQGHWRQ